MNTDIYKVYIYGICSFRNKQTILIRIMKHNKIKILIFKYIQSKYIKYIY